MNQQAWTWVGVLLGAAAGVLGAYAGWKQANSSRSGSHELPNGLWVAVATLGLALGLGAVVTRVRLGMVGRGMLLLPVGFLGYWFIRHLGAILLARGKKREDGPAGRQRK